MAFDLDAFLKELGVSGEEEATLKAAMGKPERLQALEKGYLRQSDYSKHMNDLKKTQDDLAAKQQRLDAEAAEWATLSAAERENATKLRSDLEKHQQQVLALQQRVTRIATDAGLDPVKALEGIDQAPPEKKEPPVPPVDTSKFVQADQFGQFGNYMFELATTLPVLAAEHLALTGTPLDTRALGAEITKRASIKGANLDPRAVWEEVHGIPQIRQTKATAVREAELTAAEQRGFERARTEAALPVAPSTGVHSPALRGLDGKARESVLKRPGPETGVRGAAAALASGKYREQPAGAAK